VTTTQTVVAILKRTGDHAAQVVGGWRDPHVSLAGFRCIKGSRTVSVYYYPLNYDRRMQLRKLGEYASLLLEAGYTVKEVDGLRLEVWKQSR
jgi:hypothetical protein